MSGPTQGYHVHEPDRHALCLRQKLRRQGSGLPYGQGGIFSTNIMMMLLRLVVRQKLSSISGPPVWVALSIVLNIPLVDRLNKNPCKVIETGDWVKVDGRKGTVEVTKKKD